MTQDAEPAALTPLDRYKARIAAAGEILQPALRRNPGDTRAWDAHADEIRAAQAELREADPETASAMLVADMEHVARLGTPPMEDTRTAERRASDARFDR